MAFNRVQELSYPDEVARVFPGGFAKDITFQVTEDCNLHCTYCYQICKSKAVLLLDTAKLFIDELLIASEADSEKNNVAAVLNFVGGEPFLQTKLIDDILDYWVMTCAQMQHPWARNFMVSISTNGTLVRTPEVEAFIKKWRNRLSVSVSLDGNEALHNACRIYADGRGSYDDALQAVFFLREQFGDIPTKMTFAPENIEYMFDAFKNLIDLDYQLIHANCIFEEGWTLEHARIEYQQLKKTIDWMLENDKEEINISMFDEGYFAPLLDDDTQNWCGGDGRMIAVNHTGRIYPCLRYMESSLGDKTKPIVCGHVETGIDLDQLSDMRTITRQSQSTQECIDCSVAAGCAWCTAYNYQKFGTINHRATFICWMHRAESLANVYYWNRVYEKHGIQKVFDRHLPDDLALQIIDEQELELLNTLTKGKEHKNAY